MARRLLTSSNGEDKARVRRESVRDTAIFSRVSLLFTIAFYWTVSQKLDHVGQEQTIFILSSRQGISDVGEASVLDFPTRFTNHARRAYRPSSRLR